MSLNGAGIFTVNSAGQPVVASTLITSAAFNAFTADVATALSTAIYRDGQAVQTANQPMGGFKHTGAGAAVASGEYLMYGQSNASLTSLSINGSAITLAGAFTTTGAFATTFAIPGAFTYTFPPATSTIASAQTLQSQLYQAFTTGGTSTAYTLTPAPAITANTTNQRFRVAFHTTAGATPTLAVSGQTAKNLKYKDSTGAKAAVTTTQIPASWIADVEYDGTDWVVLDVPPSTSGVSSFNTRTGAVTFLASDLPAGSVVQVVNTQTGAYATGSTAIPYDDTIPQNTEGDEYMTLAVTPTSASNKLKITVVVNGAETTNSADAFTVALFQDATAGALAAAAGTNAGILRPYTTTFAHYMTAGTTSATTFKVRAGNNVATPFDFNGYGARLYGGVCASSITIEEIKV